MSEREPVAVTNLDRYDRTRDGRVGVDDRRAALTMQRAADAPVDEQLTAGVVHIARNRPVDVDGRSFCEDQIPANRAARIEPTPGRNRYAPGDDAVQVEAIGDAQVPSILPCSALMAI